MTNDFQVACERARIGVGGMIWMTMSSGARSRAIYQELRAIDAEQPTTNLNDERAKTSFFDPDPGS